jgi:hypothetical protein
MLEDIATASDDALHITLIIFHFIFELNVQSQPISILLIFGTGLGGIIRQELFKRLALLKNICA